MRRIMLLGMVVLLVACGVRCGRGSSKDVVEPPIKQQGIPAPDFTLPAMSGESISLSDYRGKGVLLFFWTTRCPYCAAEIDMLRDRHKELQERGIEVVSIDVGEPQSRVAQYLSRKKLPFPVLLDPYLHVASPYQVLGVPTIILISANQEVMYKGYETPQNLYDYFQ